MNMRLKTAKEIIDGFPAHIKRKHKGRREVSHADISKAQVVYLQWHLDRRWRAGWQAGVNDYKWSKKPI